MSEFRRQLTANSTLLVSLVLLLSTPVLGSQQAPVFRGSLDVVLIEAHVVARDSTPILGLPADQFEVFVDGKRRRIISADFVSVMGAPGQPGASMSPSPGVTASRTPNGRTFVLAIDQASFPMSAQASAREAARRVIDGLTPNDELGLVAFPGPVSIAPTREHDRVREAVKQIGGVRVEFNARQYNISAQEASLLKSRDPVATREITQRECRSAIAPDCGRQVLQEGQAISDMLEQQAMLSINGLHGTLSAMESLPGRKTLIVVSAGLPMSSRPGGQPNLDHETARIAKRAAAANINLYVFYMNVHFLRYFSAEYGRRNHSIFEDVSLFGYGLEKFADSGGGQFFQVEVDSDPFVNRVLRETSAFYMLAVSTEPSDRDGKEHFIRVATKQRGASLRYRKVLMIPKE
jgi:VWFA-related protein